MGYSETQQTTGQDTTREPGIKRTGLRNLLTALTVAARDGSARGHAFLADFTSIYLRKRLGTSFRTMRCFSTVGIELDAGLE
jgi:hypothetical protein